MDTFEKAVREAGKRLHRQLRAAMKETRRFSSPLIFHSFVDHSAETDGVLSRFLVGMEGVLKRIDIFTEDLPEKTIPVSVGVLDPVSGKSSVEKDIKAGHTGIELDIPVSAGCRVVVHSPTFITDVYVTSAVSPKDVRAFALKEIEDEGE